MATKVKLHINNKGYVVAKKIYTVKFRRQKKQMIIKKPTLKELSDHLGNITVAGLKQRPAEERKLMILGLWKHNEIKNERLKKK